MAPSRVRRLWGLWPREGVSLTLANKPVHYPVICESSVLHLCGVSVGLCQ